MARGGARPGAGRPRKSAVTPVDRPKVARGAAAQKVASAGSLPADVIQPAADAGLSPLDYMLMVMRDAEEDPARRDRMAVAAAPFVHARAADAKSGKKDEQAAAAKKVAATKFKPSAPPLKLVRSD